MSTTPTEGEVQESVAAHLLSGTLNQFAVTETNRLITELIAAAEALSAGIDTPSQGEQDLQAALATTITAYVEHIGRIRTGDHAEEA